MVRRLVMIVTALGAVLGATAAAVPAQAEAAVPCYGTANRDVIDFVLVGDGDGAYARPPTVDLVGAGMETKLTGQSVTWLTTPRQTTRLRDIRWLAYETYRHASGTGYNPAVLLVLDNGTELEWRPGYQNGADRWVKRNVGGSATFAGWLTAHGDRTVVRYGVTLRNAPGAVTRFNTVTFRTDRFCTYDHWIRYP